MTITPRVLYAGGQIGNVAAPLYVVPANTKAILNAATFTNTDTADRLLTVYIVRSGGAPTPANTLIDAMTLRPGQAYVSPELLGQTLASGDAVQAMADAASLITCAGVSGYEIT